VVLMEPS